MGNAGSTVGAWSGRGGRAMRWLRRGMRRLTGQ